MNLIINGEMITVPVQVTTITELLAHFHLEQKVVIVELNQRILDTSSEHDSTFLSDRDKIEIVHFVGGG